MLDEEEQHLDLYKLPLPDRFPHKWSSCSELTECMLRQFHYPMQMVRKLSLKTCKPIASLGKFGAQWFTLREVHIYIHSSYRGTFDLDQLPPTLTALRIENPSESHGGHGWLQHLEHFPRLRVLGLELSILAFQKWGPGTRFKTCRDLYELKPFRQLESLELYGHANRPDQETLPDGVLEGWIQRHYHIDAIQCTNVEGHRIWSIPVLYKCPRADWSALCHVYFENGLGLHPDVWRLIYDYLW